MDDPVRREGGREGGREGEDPVRAYLRHRKKNEIKKFITLERIAEQVSFFDCVFFTIPPITRTNLDSIRKTRFDQLII